MLTLAPGVTLWDSGEFLAAIHSLGIPHPPGTPLYILIAKVWSLIFGSVFGFARSINLLSAFSLPSPAESSPIFSPTGLKTDSLPPPRDSRRD